MLNKKQKKIVIFVLMIIYSYVILSSKVICKSLEKDYLNVPVPSAIVIDSKTGRVLYSHNKDEKRKMASLTKIMTSILLIENTKESDIITAPKEVEYIGGSLMGLSAGDKLTSRDLLIGMLLPSGNDAAYTAAIHISGTVENFAELMNKKAKEIGAFNTSFENPHGLDSDNHFTTAYDLAVITRYALKYDIFNEIIKSKYLEVTISSRKVLLFNTNALLKKLDFVDGGKTGYTDGAGRCLMCTGKKDNLRIIAVVLGAETTDERFDTCERIMKEVFNRYKVEDVSNYLNFDLFIPVIKGEEESYKFSIKESGILYPILEEEKNRICIKKDIIDKLCGGDLSGKYLGKIQMVLDDDIIFEKNYILENDLKKKSVFKYLKELFLKITC